MFRHPVRKKYASILRDFITTATKPNTTAKIRFESLEDRLAPATMVWDGGGGNNLWSTAANWTHDVVPQAGDNLLFPAGAAQTTNVNDLPAGLVFNTVQFTGSGFNITGNAIQLSGGLTANNVGGTNTFGLDTTLVNAQTFMNANPSSTLNLSGTIHTANLVGATQIFGTTGLNFDGTGLTNVVGIIDGQGSVTKYGGGTLTLSGANTYAGITDVRQGVLVANHDSALGSATTGDTQIQAGAALHVSGGRTIAEPLAIREGGVGFGNGTDGSLLGALRSIGGNNTWTGNIDLAGGNNLVGVDAGSALTVSGTIANAIGSVNRLIKVGDGTLQLAGTSDNILRGEIRVLDGTLELNKTPGKNAFSGNLVIGDNISGDNAATVRLLANDQIPQLDYFDVAVNTITLNSSALLDFNGFSDTIGNLILTTGTTYSADVLTGSGTLGMGGNLTVNGFSGSSGATPAATISGNLDLGTFFSGGGAGTGAGGTRQWAINDSQLPNIAADLNISANISGSSAVSISRTGAGTLRLGGNNTFSGPFIWNGGQIEAASNTAFGTGLLSPQNNGNVLIGVGGPRTISNVVSLDGNLSTLGSNLTFSGPMTLTGDRAFLTMDPAQTVTISGVIDEGIFGSRTFNKNGRGTLVLTEANTYSGGTTVSNDGGTLILRDNGSLLNVNAITIGVGSTLQLDNNSGANVANRLNDAMTINVNGRLHFVGSAGANSTEYTGPINTGGGLASTIEMENTSAGAFSSVLTANALGLDSNRTINFVGTGMPLSASGANRVSFVNNPGNLDDGILNASRVTGSSGVEFATLEPSAEGVAVVAYPTAGYITDINQASATSNVKITTPGVYTLTSSKSINSLILGPGVTLAGDSVTLTINSSNMLFLGAGSSTISVSNLNVTNGSIFVDTGMTVSINSNIIGSNVNKGGAGKLILTGDNQHAGNTVVNEGVLNIQRSTALGSPAGGTFIRPNASLEIEQTTFGPVNIGLESLTVDGLGSLTNIGALRNIAGNNSIAGTVALAGSNANLLDVYDGFPVINPGVALIDVATGSELTLTGDVTGTPDLGKLGGGTLELAGVISRGQDRNNRIFEGTMLLNNEAGVQASRGRYFVGTDKAGAPAATLMLGNSDQIIDDRRVEVFSSGVFDLNGFNEVIAEGNLILHVGPAGAGDVNIGSGGTLTTNANILIHTVGTNNPVGSTITGGTLALQVFGIAAAAGTRTWEINDGAAGSDLTVSSAIVDGTGLQSVGIIKTGFGTLTLDGTTANTFTGTTTINDGTLILDKGTGSGGVNALAGPVTIGNNDVSSGFSSSDILRLNQPNQLPDYLSLVTVNTTGLFDLNGNDETIGVADAQTALSMQASATVDLNGATLSVIGNIATNSANGVGLWTPVVAPQIIDGTLNLGAVPTTIDVGGDRSELPYELQISADITGTGGFLLANTGTLLLDGDNSGLSGDVIRTNGNFAIGSDTAFGAGRLLFNDGHLTTFHGPRTITNEVLSANTPRFIGGNNTANSGAIGGGVTI